MSASSESTTGIPNSDKPGRWIVPPWPAHASLCDVAGHFSRFTPGDNGNVAEKLAYYQGFRAAIEIQQANRNVRSLRTATRAAPTPHEQAS